MFKVDALMNARMSVGLNRLINNFHWVLTSLGILS